VLCNYSLDCNETFLTALLLMGGVGVFLSGWERERERERERDRQRERERDMGRERERERWSERERERNGWIACYNP
jgi:hypothetical protein